MSKYGGNTPTPRKPTFANSVAREVFDAQALKLAAANQEIDALRAELSMANASREKLSQKLADVQHAHSGSLDVVDHLRSELAALRQSTEADAKPARHFIAAAWSDPPDLAAEIAKLRKERDDLYQRAATAVSSPNDLGRSYIAQMGKMVAPVPAPSPSAEEPFGYAVRYSRGTMIYATRDAAQSAGGFSEVVPLYTAPPDLTAEIARLMMEKERKQHMLEEQLAEIAKLKAQLDGTRREKIVTGRIVRLGRVSYLEKVGESPSRFGITTDRARAHRFLNDVRFVRLVRKPAVRT